MKQQTIDGPALADVVRGIAASRDMTLEEVAYAARGLGFDYTADELAGGKGSGFGDALDAVLRLDAGERERVLEAFMAVIRAMPRPGEARTADPKGTPDEKPETPEALGTDKRERPDPAGCVRRGMEARSVRIYFEHMGSLPKCRVGAGVERGLYAPECERPAVMEVYGIEMCEAHGEEAAAGALEEIHDDLDNELQRPTNPHSLPISAHMQAVYAAGFDVIETGGEVDAVSETALLEAFPLGSGTECATIGHHVEDPDWNADAPPYDAFRDDRLLLHRHMRLAFERGADWLVETLEGERAQTAAQAAFALARERDAGLRPAG